MELGYIVSLIILGVSLIILIVMGFLAMKKMKPTLKNIEETQKTVEGHVEHFTNEAEAIQTKVDHIMARVEYTQNISEMKLQRFDDFQHYAESLSHSLQFLKEHGNEYSKGAAENTLNELRTDGPRLAKTFKLAFSKTIEKQKQRKHNEDHADLPAVVNNQLVER